jgi:iron complex outermembrane receptor protein
MKLVAAVLFLFSSFSSWSQYTIQGYIHAEEGRELSGVEIVCAGDTVGSDPVGKFIFKDVPEGKYLLSAEFTGYSKTYIDIVVNDDPLVLARNSDIRIVMRSIEYTDDGQSLILKDVPSYISQESVLIEVIMFKNGMQPSPINIITRDELKPLNNGQDMPYVLRAQPSLVTTSDAGNGIGYTGMWIRGSDGSRINVTINGVALNDPESQQVYWVDLPDVSTSMDHVTIQRGVGASTNGTGAFGASVQIETEALNPNPYARITSGAGSFNTFKNNIQFGSGLIKDHWTLEGRLSRISSDGYMDRAKSNLESFHVSGTYKTDKTTIRLLTMGGHERTYQSWYGVPQSRLTGDREAMLTHAANEGYTDEQLDNLLNSGRTYNYYMYENEVDDYTQNHYQFHVFREIDNGITAKLTGFYTRGFGYFEQYRQNEDMSIYGLNPISIARDSIFSDGINDDGYLVSNQFSENFIQPDLSFYYNPILTSNGDSIGDGNGNFLLDAVAQIDRTDLVRQRWLSNHYYGTNFMLNYNDWKRNRRYELTLGLSAGFYDGDHFGKITWAQYANDIQPGHEFYSGRSHKSDLSGFLKGVFRVTNRSAFFVDVQTRAVGYQTKGVDVDLRSYDVVDDLFFVNPKVGYTYRNQRNYLLYASASVANREPARTDYVDAPQDIMPKPESMIDFELGFRRTKKNIYYSGNMYWMQYKDQLVLTGAINDVGSSIRINVPQSYRAGVELEAMYEKPRKYSISGNITLSQNRIGNFNQVTYDYTNDFFEVNQNFKNTDIAFSPRIIAALQAQYHISLWDIGDVDLRKLTFGALFKHVGRQFLDNTSDANKVIPDYTVVDLLATYSTRLFEKNKIEFSIWLMNALNREYVSNGYTYSYIYGNPITENFYYPQAGRNVMGSVVLEF